MYFHPKEGGTEFANVFYNSEIEEKCFFHMSENSFLWIIINLLIFKQNACFFVRAHKPSEFHHISHTFVSGKKNPKKTDGDLLKGMGTCLHFYQGEQPLL